MRVCLACLLSIFSVSPRAASSPAAATHLDAEVAQQVVAEAQKKDMQATELGNIPTIVPILVASTRFAGHVNLNGQVQDSALNIYILAPHLKQQENVPDVFFDAGIFGNCAFVGVRNTIVCDFDFLAGFLQDHRIAAEWRDKHESQAGWTYQEAFLAWILGHELGHVVQGGPAAHFGQENVLDKATDAGIELSQKAEMEADLFAAKRIEADRKLTGTLERLLLTLINEEVEAKNGKSPAYGVGLHWDYADKVVIAYFTKKDHPEFVVRATRMLNLLAADTHDDGLKALIETFSRHLVGVAGGGR